MHKISKWFGNWNQFMDEWSVVGFELKMIFRWIPYIGTSHKKYVSSIIMIFIHWYFALSDGLHYISMVSCQKGPTQIGPFWQDTLDIIIDKYSLVAKQGVGCASGWWWSGCGVKRNISLWLFCLWQKTVLLFAQYLFIMQMQFSCISFPFYCQFHSHRLRLLQTIGLHASIPSIIESLSGNMKRLLNYSLVF